MGDELAHAGSQGGVDMLDIEGGADDPADFGQGGGFAPPAAQRGGCLLLLGDIGVGHQGTALAHGLHLHPKPAIGHIFVAIREGLEMVRPAARGHGEDAVGQIRLVGGWERINEALTDKLGHIGTGDRRAVGTAVDHPQAPRIVGLGPPDYHGQRHLLDDPLVEPALDVTDGRTDDLANLGHPHTTRRAGGAGDHLLLLGDIGIGYQGTALAQRSHVKPKPVLRNSFVAVPIDFMVLRRTPRGHGEVVVG